MVKKMHDKEIKCFQNRTYIIFLMKEKNVASSLNHKNYFKEFWKYNRFYNNF